MSNEMVQVDFGTAIRWLREGLKLRREGWNGKGMFLIYVPGTLNVAPTPNSPYDKALSKGSVEGYTVTIADHIDMFTADGIFQPGWLASQADLLTDDWEIVTEVIEETNIILPDIGEYKVYSKTATQPMYPYELGMSMEGISVAKGDTPEVGGMIAFDSANLNDRWYISKEFFEANYLQTT